MDTLKVILETKGSNSNFIEEVLKVIIPALITGVIAFAGVWLGGLLNNKITMKSLKAKANEPEIQEIRDSIRTFYQPMLLLLRKNKQLYEMFSYNKPDDFRTLIALLNGQEFEGNDAKLLEAIINIDKEINEIIAREKSKIKNENILETLAKASAHFEIITMAYDGMISGETERFKEYVFPNELHEQIESEIITLRKELERLGNS